MSVQFMMPQQQSSGSPFSKMLGLAAGIATGNPMAAAGSLQHGQAGPNPLDSAKQLLAPASAGPDSAISRRMGQISGDHANIIASGLEALRDPSVPQEIRDAYAEPMLRAHDALKANPYMSRG